MSIQVKRRREAASFLATFTGAAAELVVDTTNNRVQVHDGATPGGWPAAKLSEAQTIGRTVVSDANYTILVTDVLVSITALTASRTLTLPASSAYPIGRVLCILDESGAASASPQIMVAASGSDTVDGASSAVVQAAYGSLELISNGAGKWFKLQDFIATIGNLATLGINTAADPTNPLSATLNAALFNALATTYGGTGDVRVKLNKQTYANTASFLFQDAFSGRAEIGLTGDDNFHLKVSPNGNAWNTGLLIDATTGALTPGNARTAISDAAYSALATDRIVAYSALTAAQIVSLPAASSYPAGVPLIVLDESGACSAVKTITINRAGSDTINGATNAVLSSAYAFVALESNGSNAWTIVDSQIVSTNITDSTSTGRSLVTAASANAARSTLSAARTANLQTFTSSGTYTPTAGMTFCDVYLFGGGGGGGGGGCLEAASTACSGGGGGGGGGYNSGRFTAAQIGASQSVTIGAGGSAGLAATSNTTSGGTGGLGGATSLGSILSAFGGGGGAGGQLAGVASGGGGGGALTTGASGSGATGGVGGYGGSSGGSGVAAANTINASCGSGGGGCSAAGVAAAAGVAIAPTGGGAGGGVTAGNVANNGALGGIQIVAGVLINGGSAGVAGSVNGGPGSTRSSVGPLQSGGMGGGGGASTTSGTAGHGGAGGTPGGGGGGGASATNGGTASSGGAGGAGLCYIVEFF